MTDSDPARPRPIGRADLLAATACLALGVLMALWPHLLWWGRLGEPVYLADHDDLLYLCVSGQAYFNHPTSVGDPTRVSGGGSQYPAAQFVPGIVVARALGLGPLAVDLVWRAWAGLSIALGLYLLARHELARPALAAGVTAALLVDAGFLQGQPLLRPAVIAARLLAGRPGALLESFPQVFGQWRIITPGLSLGALLLHLWLTARARARPSWGRLALSGLGFGLLFYVYFYYWTAAGLALLAATALDAGHRRAYFHSGWIGGLIGLPAVVGGFLMKSSSPPDWLSRTDNFLPIARFSELMVPKLALVTLALTLAWVAWRRRELLYLWILAASGLALMNHQVVSGLQIQNFHWTYAWGPCLSILLALLAARELAAVLRPSRALTAGLVVLLAADVAVGFALRSVEALQTRETRTILANYRLYRAQRLGPGAPALEPRAVVAGDPDFLDLAAPLENLRPLDHYAVLFSPTVRDDEWDGRIALNAYLRGVSRGDFARHQEKELATAWGPWSRDARSRAERVARRLAAFDAVAADPSAALDRREVRYLALPAGQAPPPALPDTDWRPLQRGPTWDLWARPQDAPATLKPQRRGGDRVQATSS